MGVFGALTKPLLLFLGSTFFSLLFGKIKRITPSSDLKYMGVEMGYDFSEMGLESETESQ